MFFGGLPAEIGRHFGDQIGRLLRLADHRGHGAVVARGRAEVAARQAADVARVADVERLVEVPLAAHLADGLRVRARAEHRAGDPAPAGTDDVADEEDRAQGRNARGPPPEGA